MLVLVPLHLIAPSHPFLLIRLDWQLQWREVRLQQSLVRGLLTALLQLPLRRKGNQVGWKARGGRAWEEMGMAVSRETQGMHAAREL